RWLIMVCIHDITERKAATAKADLLAKAIDLGHDPVGLIDREEMRVIEVNKAACAAAGLSYDEYLKAKAWETFDGQTRADRERVYDELIALSPQPQTAIERVTSHDGRQRTISTIRQALKI